MSLSIWHWLLLSRSNSRTLQHCFQIMLFLHNLFLCTCLTATAFALPSPTTNSMSQNSPKHNSASAESSSRGSSTSFFPAASPLDRTIDLSSLGIDLGVIFDRLLSPAGIVQQFVLTLALGKSQHSSNWQKCSPSSIQLCSVLLAGFSQASVTTRWLAAFQLDRSLTWSGPSTLFSPPRYKLLDFHTKKLFPFFRQLHKLWSEMLSGQFGIWLPGLSPLQRSSESLSR